MITVELEHFSLDKICDSGQCFRMRKLGDGHFSMVAGDQYLEMYQKDGVVDRYVSDISAEQYQAYPQMYRNHLPEVRRAKKFICRCGILRFSDCRGAESGNGRGVKRMRPGIPGKIYRSNGQDHCIRSDLPGKNL